MTNNDSFKSGVWFAIQELVLSHGELTIATDIAKSAGISRKEARKLQEETDFETTRMKKFIKELDS